MEHIFKPIYLIQETEIISKGEQIINQKKKL